MPIASPREILVRRPFFTLFQQYFKSTFCPPSEGGACLDGAEGNYRGRVTTGLLSSEDLNEDNFVAVGKRKRDYYNDTVIQYYNAAVTNDCRARANRAISVGN